MNSPQVLEFIECVVANERRDKNLDLETDRQTGAVPVGSCDLETRQKAVPGAVLLECSSLRRHTLNHGEEVETL